MRSDCQMLHYIFYTFKLAHEIGGVSEKDQGSRELFSNTSQGSMGEY